MIEFVKQTAIRAGLFALSEQRRLDTSAIYSKETAKDLVTDTDRAVEQLIVSELEKRFPGYGIYGEEFGHSNTNSEYCWLIDPIDGTASFIHGLPNWAISIGLHKNGVPVLGVVYSPVMNKLYYAETGKGSWCNGEKLSVSPYQKLSDVIVSTGIACIRSEWTEENNLKFLSRIAPKVVDFRKYGSAALDCCSVASGQLGAYWELKLEPYDYGAGELIVTEAGGRVSDLYGKNNYPEHGIIFTNSSIHDEILQEFYDYKALHK